MPKGLRAQTERPSHAPPRQHGMASPPQGTHTWPTPSLNEQTRPAEQDSRSVQQRSESPPQGGGDGGGGGGRSEQPRHPKAESTPRRVHGAFPATFTTPC
jgi:hypothetical protein